MPIPDRVLILKEMCACSVPCGQSCVPHDCQVSSSIVTTWPSMPETAIVLTKSPSCCPRDWCLREETLPSPLWRKSSKRRVCLFLAYTWTEAKPEPARDKLFLTALKIQKFFLHQFLLTPRNILATKSECSFLCCLSEETFIIMH